MVKNNRYCLQASNFIRGAGTVTFNGSSAQTIDSPAQFNNLTIANTAGAVFCRKCSYCSSQLIMEQS